MAQDALYAAHADAVPLSQFSLWCTGTAVCQQLADDLLAQSVDESPASASRKRGSGAAVVELDMADRLGSMRHYVQNSWVRVVAHKLHQRVLVRTGGAFDRDTAQRVRKRTFTLDTLI